DANFSAARGTRKRRPGTCPDASGRAGNVPIRPPNRGRFSDGTSAHGRRPMNERLRAAMTKAQLSVDELADVAGVDPKPVQRWLGGRTPHARHRWSLGKALGEDERDLWPTSEKTITPGAASTAEVLAAYGHRADVPTERWWELLTAGRSQID